MTERKPTLDYGTAQKPKTKSGAGYKRPEGAAWRLGCAGLLLMCVGFPVVEMISFPIAYRTVQRPILNSLYGPGSYATGLRVVGKHGELSDGRRLPEGWNTALAIGAFILELPVLLGYLAIVYSLGFNPADPFKRR